MSDAPERRTYERKSHAVNPGFGRGVILCLLARRFYSVGRCPGRSRIPFFSVISSQVVTALATCGAMGDPSLSEEPNGMIVAAKKGEPLIHLGTTK